MIQPDKETYRAYTPKELINKTVLVSFSSLNSVKRAQFKDIKANSIITNVVAFRLSGDRREDPDGKISLELVLGTPESFSDYVPTEPQQVVAIGQVAQADLVDEPERFVR